MPRKRQESNQGHGEDVIVEMNVRMHKFYMKRRGAPNGVCPGIVEFC